MSESRFCFWCHEPLPPLSEHASYVDEINHSIHDACRDERDDNNRRMEQLGRESSMARSTQYPTRFVKRFLIASKTSGSMDSRRTPAQLGPL
jgi:hypothetical protein